ncbi:SDR family NAD(P)-dependent oxidoreductase [Azospirillum sp. B4]|uniref:SDR family NAD(P)-dependent oxidoreductase n=1 Tax=Azospirillum sp. B4 TaxID=95605 RepID=UPI00034758A0|nr:SDR family NAD(P)-dependent oxidoreductase [Azospirillum sp. B4]
MPSYPDLKGKVALVTGAGRLRGLGAAIALRLAEEGCRVVLHDVAPDAAARAGVPLGDEMAAVKAAVTDLGVDCATVTADLRVEDEVRGMVDQAVGAFGQLDILVNNAGIGFLVGAVTEMPVADWDAVMGVNLRGAFLAMKYAGAAMIERGQGGRIVSIASQAAKSGISLMSAYSASKHGLIGLTRSAAIEFGRHGVTVNAICPNHVPTDLGDWQRETLSRRRGVDMTTYWQRLRDRVPLGRPGAVADTANACAFLCSDQASYITGEAMNVSGGEEYH